MQHPRQDATHSSVRAIVVALTLISVLIASALAAVSAGAATTPETAIDSGPPGTYRWGTAQFSLSSPAGGASFECRLDSGVWAACTAHPSFEVANGSHRLEVRAVAAGQTDPTPAEHTWWADATIQNGNFETEGDGWLQQGFTMPGWKTDSSNTGLSLVAGGPGGAHAGRATATGAGSLSLRVAPRPVNAAQAGTKFTASGMVRSSAPGARVCLRIREWSPADAPAPVPPETETPPQTILGAADSCVNANSSWQSFPALDYTTTGAGSEIDVYAYRTTNAAAGDWFELDAIALKDTDPLAVPPTPEVTGDPVLLGLGDIASCWSSGDEATARLLDTTPGVIGIVGDTEQNNATAPEFKGCYDATWGRHNARTRPAVGDHEYRVADATGYFDYFGSRAGPRLKGWYSYDLGNWHIVVLNSNCELIGGCGPGSEQYEWLQQDLHQNAGDCVGAYVHHPRWSAGALHGDQTRVAPFWDLLYEYSAEFVYGGNDHTYQRFAPQTPAGLVDRDKGLRQFVLGTGGTQHYPLTAPKPNTEVQHTGTFGVMRFTLHANSYDWRFLPQAGRSFTDSGSTDCSPLLVDNKAPETTISSPPADVTGSQVSVGFGSTESGSSFECRLDAAPQWTACTSPRALTGLASGSHTFRVRAQDAAGNVDATPAERTWTVDADPPGTTIESGPSGLVASDEATFTMAASESGSTFECQVDGAAQWTGCSSPRTLTGLGQGAHSFRVRARDAVGNVDASPAERTWTVDTHAPDTTIESGPSGTVASTSATLSFSASETGTFECRVDGAAQWTTCSSPRTLTGLGQGAHSLAVRARDSAGNLDATPAERTWTVDTQAPETAIESGPSGLVAVDEATFTLGSSEGGSTFECQVDGASQWTACSSPRTLTGLGQGAHSFRVRARDAVGNVDATPAERTWTVDTHAPDTTIDSGPSGLERSTSAHLTFSSSEAGSSFECRLDAGDWAPCASPRDLTGLADGPHVMRARAMDAAGNVDPTPAERAWTVDTEIPETRIESGPSGLAATDEAAFTLGSSEDGSSFECRLDDAAAWSACSSPTEFTGLNQGRHTIRVRATDAAGNTDASPAERTWTVDTVPPRTVIRSGPASGGRSTRAGFSFTAETGATFQCRLDDAGWRPCASPFELTGLAVGGHVLRVRATDAAGNVDPTGAVWAWTIAAPSVVVVPPPTTPDTPEPPTMRDLATALRADVLATVRVLRRTHRARLARRGGLTVRGLDAALPGRFHLRLRRGGALLGRGRSASIRAGRHSVRLRLTRTGVRKLARGSFHRVTLEIEFRDSAGRTVRISARLPLRA